MPPIPRSFAGAWVLALIGCSTAVVASAPQAEVTNGTPFFARIVVYGEEAARLGPGETAYDTRRSEPLPNPRVPVAALLYRDVSMRDYVGGAGRVFFPSGSSPTSFSWALELSEFQTPDGRYLSARESDVYPTPNTKRKSSRVAFPREWWNATAGLQIVNNTVFQMTIRVDARERRTLATGEVEFLSEQELFGVSWVSGRRVWIQLVFTEDGRLRGTSAYRVDFPLEGVDGLQFVVGPQNIR